MAHPQSGYSSTDSGSNWNLECWCLWREEKRRTRRKTLGARKRTNGNQSVRNQRNNLEVLQYKEDEDLRVSAVLQNFRLLLSVQLFYLFAQCHCATVQMFHCFSVYLFHCSTVSHSIWSFYSSILSCHSITAPLPQTLTSSPVFN